MTKSINSSIAVVGVSSNPDKYGHKIFRDLLAGGYEVYGINPKADKILDQKVYPSLKDLPLVPDMVMTVVPPQVTEQVVDMCHDLGIHSIWMQPGSESDSAVAKAKEYGMDVIANACFMKEENIW